jgi:hypothetical protein
MNTLNLSNLGLGVNLPATTGYGFGCQILWRKFHKYLSFIIFTKCDIILVHSIDLFYDYTLYSNESLENLWNSFQQLDSHISVGVFSQTEIAGEMFRLLAKAHVVILSSCRDASIGRAGVARVALVSKMTMNLCVDRNEQISDLSVYCGTGVLIWDLAIVHSLTLDAEW